MEECVLAVDFPAWYYAELLIGGEARVISVFHVKTPSGVIPYWYEDPENQHRGLPLTKSMRPKLLGDYGSILAAENNIKIFVAICLEIDDLPDPLLAVQVIQWVNAQQSPWMENIQPAISDALRDVNCRLKQRRQEFERVMGILMGKSAVLF